MSKFVMDHNRRPGDGVAYTVLCFSPFHPDVQAAGDCLQDRLARLVGEKKITHLYVPVTGKTTGGLARRSDLRGHGTFGANHTELLKSSKPAEVVELRPRDGVYLQTAGAFVLAATGGDHCIMGRCARGSLIPEDRVLENPLDHDGVIQSVMGFFATKGISSRNVLLRGFFGLPAATFVVDPSHCEVGEKNRIIMENIHRLESMAVARNLKTQPCVYERDGVPYLSLCHLLRLIAQLHDVPEKRVGCEKTFPERGLFAYSRHPEPQLTTEFNSVVAWRMK